MNLEAPRANEFGPPSPARRRFLTQISVVMMGVITAIVGIPFLGFLLGPLLKKPPEAWTTVNPVSKFKVGETVLVSVQDPSPLPWAGLAAKTAIWLRREGEQEFIAFSVNCTHLGCPVRWLPNANLFMCPCHGGVFYSDGRVAGGPPPRPLTQFPARIVNDKGTPVVQVLVGPSPLGVH